MERLLSEKEVEQIYGISRRWLQKKRCTGGGITYFKIGKSIKYRASDIESFLESHRRSSTSDPGREATR